MWGALSFRGRRTLGASCTSRQAQATVEMFRNAPELDRTISERGNPELKTLSAILKVMGMRLAVQPLSHDTHA